MTEIVAEIVAERASLRHHNIVVVSVPANATGGRPRSGCMMIMSHNIIYILLQVFPIPLHSGASLHSWRLDKFVVYHRIVIDTVRL